MTSNFQGGRRIWCCVTWCDTSIKRRRKNVWKSCDRRGRVSRNLVFYLTSFMNAPKNFLFLPQACQNDILNENSETPSIAKQCCILMNRKTFAIRTVYKWWTSSFPLYYKNFIFFLKKFRWKLNPKPTPPP